MNHKSIHHSFDTELAAKYGIKEAIIIHHFQHWIGVNFRRKKNLIDGRTWTYQSCPEIKAHFPYLTEKEIRGAIERLVESGVLLKINFNKKSYDKTNWYAFCEEDIFLNKNYDIPKGPIPEGCDKRADGCDKRADGSVQKGRPIPDTKTDTKTDIIPPISPPKGDGSLESFPKEVIDLCQDLLDRIKRINPALKQPKMEKWCSDMDLLIRVDKRPISDVSEAIRYIFEEDDFYPRIILSPSSLRRNFDKIWMKKTPINTKMSLIKENIETVRKMKRVLKERQGLLILYKDAVANKDTGDSVPLDLPCETFTDVLCNWTGLRRK